MIYRVEDVLKALDPSIREQVDTDLLEKVLIFVGQLVNTIESSILGIQHPLKTQIFENSKIVITTREEGGLPLSVDGEHLLSLKVDYHCTWDSGGSFLAVDKSTFELVLPEVTEPLLRYDYLRSPKSDLPCAHFNVHGHRDELIYSMMAAGFRYQAKNRGKKAVRTNKVPRLAQLHLPTGGHRFRPCLEDIIQMIVFEFGIDTVDGWQDAIEMGRMIWKDSQLASAVRDNPSKAVEQLESMGFDIVAPPDFPPLNEKKLSEF
jgi:hypothetical protein